MIAYKLCRLMDDGSVTSLFINKTRKLPFNEWMEAESYPTKGYKHRPFWHCTGSPVAPHLKEEGRVWVLCEIDDFTEFNRPLSQGGKWYLARRIKLLAILNNKLWTEKN